MSKYKNLKRIAVLCGGMGGHFFPGLSIAREFTKNGGKACLITGGHKKDYQQEAAKKYDIGFFEVASSKLSRKPAGLVKFFVSLTKGYFRSVRIFRRFKPDAVIGMGSFTSLPASFAAITLRLPLFLHDGNALTGKSNVFLSRFARVLMSSFPPVHREKIKCRIEVTGLPVRQELLDSKYTKEESIKKLNRDFGAKLRKDAPTMLVFGGSQGAKTLNCIVPEAIGKAQRHRGTEAQRNDQRPTANIEHPSTIENGKLKIENSNQQSAINNPKLTKLPARQEGESLPSDSKFGIQNLELFPDLEVGRSMLDVGRWIGFQVIHLTGKTLYSETKDFYSGNGIRNLVFENFDEMALLYSASDFAICRSGGSTIAELAIFNKPALLIPLPHATDNHQLYNAEYYLESGIAELMNDSDCTPGKIAGIVAGFVEKHFSLSKALPSPTRQKKYWQ